MAPTREAEIEFRASDLIGPAGAGSNGEKLVNSLLDHYPPELQAALLKRINPKLDNELKDSHRESAAKVAGVKRVEQIHVRGGERNESDAVVTYAFLDDRGEVWKGCFPYSDLGKSSSDGHVSQRDSLADSAIAREHRVANPRQARSSNEPQQDPIDALVGASADELVDLMREHPERVDAIKAFEEATHSKPRKTVMEFDPNPESTEGSAEGSGPDPESTEGSGEGDDGSGDD